MGETSIEWTDSTWNPVRGCSRVSPGCENCYAERLASRFSDAGQPYAGLAQRTPAGPRWTRQVALVLGKLEDPLRWRRPRMVFTGSMSDLFHEDVPDVYLAAIFGVMLMSQHHTYQVLTKRPERMLRFMREASTEACIDALCRFDIPMPPGWAKHVATEMRKQGRDTDDAAWPPSHVWLGVSAEDQQRADERIPVLLETPAAVRFVSYEPALGPIRDILAPRQVPGSVSWLDSRRGPDGQLHAEIDWVIAGAESGPGARPAELDWFRSVRDQCAAAGTAFFLKQIADPAHKGRVVSTPELDGRRHVEWPR